MFTVFVKQPPEACNNNTVRLFGREINLVIRKESLHGTTKIKFHLDHTFSSSVIDTTLFLNSFILSTANYCFTKKKLKCSYEIELCLIKRIILAHISVPAGDEFTAVI